MFPTITQYALALDELSSGKSAVERKTLVENVIGYLGQRGGKKKLTLILEKLEEIAAEKEGRVQVSAITARVADTNLQKKLKEKAAALFPGKKVEMTFSVDPRVIGGVSFRTKEMRYDATLAASLKKFTEEISQ